MSRLLIPFSGDASKRISQGAGVTLAPGTFIQQMSHDVRSGALPIVLSNPGGNSQGHSEVVSLFFPGSLSVLYRTNVTDSQSDVLTTPTLAAAGLAIDPASKGGELAPYYNHAAGEISTEKENYNVFTVGDSNAFYMKVTFQMATASHAAELFIGFARCETFTRDMAARSDCYGVSIQSGNVFEFLTKNNTGTDATETDTTIDLAGATDMTVEVFVSKAGVATIKVDGTLLDGTGYSHTGMTFDSGDKLYPVIHSGTDLVAPGASALSISHFSHGTQAARS